MPLCRLCGIPHLVGVKGYGGVNSYCMDCMKKERTKNGWISEMCKPTYKFGKDKHRKECSMFYYNKYCQCKCHKKELD